MQRNEQTSLRGAHNEESATFAPEDERIEGLERALASSGLKLDEAVPLIADLLQLPVGDRYPELKLTPEEGADGFCRR